MLEKKILNINMGIRYEINPFLGLKSASKKFASILRLVGYIYNRRYDANIIIQSF